MKTTLRKREDLFLKAVCDKISKDVVNERLDYLFNWYSRKASRNKFWYNLTRFITYLIPCLITLISVYTGAFACKGEMIIPIIASLSALLVIIQHIVDHYRFYESWIRYRTTVEKLKRDAELFLNGCEPYNDNDEQMNIMKFAEMIECYTDAEFSNWVILREESNKPFKNEIQASLQSSAGNQNANPPATQTGAP